jgi:hypothetical protein
MFGQTEISEDGYLLNVALGNLVVSNLCFKGAYCLGQHLPHYNIQEDILHTHHCENLESHLDQCYKTVTDFKEHPEKYIHVCTVHSTL